jgi:hypothetical protein
VPDALHRGDEVAAVPGLVAVAAALAAVGANRRPTLFTDLPRRPLLDQATTGLAWTGPARHAQKLLAALAANRPAALAVSFGEPLAIITTGTPPELRAVLEQRRPEPTTEAVVAAAPEDDDPLVPVARRLLAEGVPPRALKRALGWSYDRLKTL